MKIHNKRPESFRASSLRGREPGSDHTSHTRLHRRPPARILRGSRHPHRRHPNSHKHRRHSSNPGRATPTPQCRSPSAGKRGRHRRRPGPRRISRGHKPLPRRHNSRHLLRPPNSSPPTRPLARPSSRQRLPSTQSPQRNEPLADRRNCRSRRHSQLLWGSGRSRQRRPLPLRRSLQRRNGSCQHQSHRTDQRLH